MTRVSPAIEVNGLAVRFEKYGHTTTALRDLSLVVPKGQWLLIIGWNGTGKSTLLRTIAGHHAPTLGTVQINGQVVCRPAMHRNGMLSFSAWLGRICAGQSECTTRNCFLVHQDPAAGTVGSLTLFDHLFQVDTNAGWLPRRGDADRYAQMLERFGLAGQLRQQAMTLSGGQRQLLTLLIAEFIQAELVLLDEPLAALDLHMAHLCIEQMRSMHAAGKTILQVTHDIRLAASLGDRVIGLRDGRVEYDATGNGRNFDELAVFLRRSEIAGTDCHESS
jgi:ABC-type uncharacterized transport system ATPase component